MGSYILRLTSISHTQGKPDIERYKYVTPHTDSKDMLQDIVTIFVDGYEGVRLVSSHGNHVDTNLIDTVRGLQAGGQVPGISQDSRARTGVILVGAPQRPIQQQQSSTASPTIGTPTPGAPSAKAYKNGRMQGQDPSKSKLGQRTAKQLPLGSQGPLHLYTRSMCSREAEAPWPFKPFQDQPLGELLIKALLQRPELAGEPPDKVETAVKSFIRNQNGELRKYHDEKDNPAVTRGSKTYAAAEQEAQKWQAEYGSFHFQSDWKSKDIPEAARKFLDSQGLREETIRKIAGLKGSSKHGSAVDETTHFTPLTNKGKQKRPLYDIEEQEAGEDEVDSNRKISIMMMRHARCLTAYRKARRQHCCRKELAKQAAVKRKQRAQEASEAATEAGASNAQQVRPGKVTKSAPNGSGDPGGRGHRRGQKAGAEEAAGVARRHKGPTGEQ